MRCVNCLGQFVTIKGDLKLKDKVLGDLVVPDTTWEQCDRCGHILYNPITMKAIEKAEADRKKDLLLNRPIRDFIPATEVAKILGCSRQAIHKHKRIRRGFIHFVMHNGSYQYLKESVELYNKTGDGRLPLAKPKPQIPSNIVDFSKHPVTIQNRQKMVYTVDAGSDDPRKTDPYFTKYQEKPFEDLIEG